MTDNKTTGIFLVVLVAVVLLIVLKQWLSVSGAKGKSDTWPLRFYLDILKTGWKIARSHLWIFWILLGVSLLSFAERTFIYYYGRTAEYFPIGHIFSFNVLFSVRNLISTFYRTTYYMPLSFTLLPSVFFLVIITLLLKPFKKLLVQASREENVQLSVNFINRNLPYFFASSVIGAALSFVHHYRPFIPNNFHFSGHFLSVVMAYWGAVISALLGGYIFNLFKTRITGQPDGKKEVFTASLRFFQPLFFFHLVFRVFEYVPTLITSLKSTHWNAYIPLPSFWFVIIFLLVPYQIVFGDVSLKKAFLYNFSLWKRHFPRMLSFLLVLFVVLLFVSYLLSFQQIFFATRFYHITEMFVTALQMLLRFWIAASIMLFCSKLLEREVMDKPLPKVEGKTL